MKRLSKGERVRAKVVEIQAGGDLLCDLQGKLIRIQNQTHQRFQINETLYLIVATENPTTFKLAENIRNFERTV
jgi:hypothetical protein